MGFSNLQHVEDRSITLEKALKVTKDVFKSAAERDIYTGDSIHIYITKADGTEEQFVELRKD